MKRTHWNLTVHFQTTDEPVGIIHASRIREKVKKVMLEYKMKKLCLDSFVRMDGKQKDNN